MCRDAPRVHVCSRRVRINAAVFAPQPEQHQLRPVVELQAEPIPAGLVRLQLMREKLVIHPTQAVNPVRLAIDRDRALGNETRQ